MEDKNGYFPINVTLDNPKKPSDKNIKPDLLKYLRNYIIVFASLVLISSSLSYLLNLHSYNLTDYTYYFQVKFLEKNYFTSALVIFFLLFFLSLNLFYSKFSDEDRMKFKHSFLIMNKKLRCFYFIENLMIYYLFLIAYNLILEPLYFRTNFRLSGHVLVCLFSSNIFMNLTDVVDLFEYYKISHFFLIAIRLFIYFLILHILYSLIWTTSYFHTFWESTLSLILGTTILSILNYVSFQIRKIK
jgi:hypothetical protein